ncbi:hypothetical protein N7528_004867 [Penicillium herquei]|nr:hypothetical protein N7528_004867 [Penicillium herquei]
MPVNHASESSLELSSISPQLGVDLSESRSSSDHLTPHTRTTYLKTASTQNTPFKKKRKREFDFGGSWIWEIGCVAVAVIGIALLVGFLIAIHGTKYADWQYTASPNTVISIIMTVTEAALLVPITACLGQLKWNLYRRSASLEYMQAIDEASRGSFGSFQILGRVLLGSKMGILTFCGAFLTILSLAVDPFAQQILSFPLRPTRSSNDTAFIQYAHNYSSGVASYFDSSGGATGLSPLLPRAILSGLALSNTSLQPECSSGSCSYPKFVSLGVCGQCKNVTEQTTQVCQGSALEKEGSSWVLSDTSITCNYTSPSGFNTSLNLEKTEADGESLSNATVFIMEYWSSTPGSTEKIFDIDSPIVSFITVSQNESILYTSSNSTAAPPKPSFTECALYWCEKEYAPSNYSGSSSGTPIFKTQQLHWVISDVLAPLSGVKALSNESSYHVTSPVLEFLPIVLESAFEGTSRAIGFDTGDVKSSLTITGLLQLSNITEVVDSVATRLTDTMRAAESGPRVRGIAFRDESFIEVRWPWIILPLCVVLGSALVLLTTSVATRKRNVVLWKNSVFPLLMTDLDIAPEYNFRSLRSVDEAKRVSKKINVVLEEDDGLRLLET